MEQVAIPSELLEIAKQKPEATLLCLAAFFQFGLHKERGLVLENKALWEALFEQIIKMDAEITKRGTSYEAYN